MRYGFYGAVPSQLASEVEIVLSVKTETTSKIELLNAGAADYLIKPEMKVAEIVDRVLQHFRGG